MVRIRPDALFLAPFPTLSGLSPASVYLNIARPADMFLCPRALCRGLLFDASQHQLNCSAGMKFGKNSYLGLGFVGFGPSNLTGFHAAYTLFTGDGPGCSLEGFSYKASCFAIEKLIGSAVGFSSQKLSADLQSRVRRIVLAQSPYDSSPQT